jgi:L-threonylcarbamoyladenylate synthase
MTLLLEERQIEKGVQIIKNGGTVAFRTETVYGLGADAANKEATDKIYAAKNRPKDKKLVIQSASIKDLKKYIPPDDFKKVEKTVRKFKRGLSIVLSNGLGIRIPSDKFAKKFLRACGMPLAVTSANISGKPCAKTWQEVYEGLDNRIDAIFMSGKCKLGTESTIIKIGGGKTEILREGAIDSGKILTVLNKIS